MQIKLTRGKKSRKLPQLLKKLEALNNKKTQIGYFKQSGNHSLADMSYAQLMYMHAHGQEFGYPNRDIFKYMKPLVGGEGSQKNFFRDLLKQYVKHNTTYTLGNMMNDIGKKYVRDGRQVFGNSSFLLVTKNPTPLVDTGELKRNFGYKTTVDYKVKKK